MRRTIEKMIAGMEGGCWSVKNEKILCKENGLKRSFIVKIPEKISTQQKEKKVFLTRGVLNLKKCCLTLTIWKM